MSTLPHTESVAGVVTPAMVHALIDYVLDKRYDPASGALGIRGRLSGVDDLTTEHRGRPVRVTYCESALAAREALLGWAPDRWLVLVTDRPEEDLGAGVLAHLIGQQLRSPDPWQAVRQRFGAIAVDARLTTAPAQRGIATGLLDVMPASGWPAAPAGVLTRDHAFGAVAREVLGLSPTPPDLLAVLGWSSGTATTGRLAELRETGGDALADAVIDWVAGALDEAGPAVAHLVREGRPTQLLPLGLVVGFLDGESTHRHEAELAIARLTSHLLGTDAARLDRSLRLIGPRAETVTATLLTDARTRADTERVIALADALIRQAGAEGLAERSDLLRSGLIRRLHRLADTLRGDPHAVIGDVERTWQAVTRHVLARVDPRFAVFRAAVRLTRWLVTETDRDDQPTPAAEMRSLAALARRQADVDGWVDAAVNDAETGVDDDDLRRALETVLTRVRDVRDRHDTEFAAALAAGTRDEAGADRGFLDHDGARIYLLERLLVEFAIPLARTEPVLLLVLDGLSTGVATEIFGDLVDDPAAGWAERLLGGDRRRAAALAVLPSVTDTSRTSLLSGELVEGQQDRETRGFQALTRAHGLGDAPLFHKRELDTTRSGSSLADAVRQAVDDVSIGLVAAVLNTIDDALDRSDPAGTHWGLDAVKHLRPLLDRARESGRTVIITSDHGHVVERRHGTQRSYPGSSFTRWRPAGSDQAGVSQGGADQAGADQAGAVQVEADEVLVEGPRVLAPGHRAVLAVNDRLRYGPLKAGYHGGAAPAEVVVPVLVMVPIEVAQRTDIVLAPPQAPAWWTQPVGDAIPRPDEALMPAQPPTLFDDEVPVARPRWGARLVGSATYAGQKQVAGRVVVTDDQVAALLDRLLDAPHRRLTVQQCALALDLAPARLVGAIEQIRKLLNVEGYSVIGRDPATGTVILDLDLAVEQFGVAP